MHRGRSVASRSERFTPGPAGEPLAGQLASRLATLSTWVAELNIARSPTTVLYWSATGACGVFSCPASAGAAGIEQAPRLAVAEMAGMSPTNGPCDTQHIATDSAANAGGKPAQAHVLAAIDQESTAEQLVRWLNHAGLRPQRVVPVLAPSLLHVVRTVISQPAASGTSAVLWFDEHQSILAAGSAGRLTLLRVLNIGVESLVDALSRPIRSGIAEAPPVTLERPEIRRLLEQSGVPTADSIFDDRHQIPGTAILPLLQPVLQRFGVELKQSLRFAIPDAERAGVAIRVIGPGAGLRRLAEVLGQSCGTPAQAAALSVVPGDCSSSARGAISAWCAVGGLELNVIPSGLAQEATLARVRTGAWAGIGAATAIMVVGAGLDFMKLANLKQEQSGLEVRAGELARVTADQTEAKAERDKAIVLERRATSQLGDTTAWSALLQAIAESTPEAIKLNSLDQLSEETGFTCRIVGTAKAEGDAAFADMVARYNQALARIPLVSGVRMGSTTRSQSGTSEHYRFELNLSVRPVVLTDNTTVQGDSQ